MSVTTALALTAILVAQKQPAPENAAEQHAVIGVGADDQEKGGGDKAGQYVHTQNPGAQWFPEAGLGLFIHWGIASVGAMNISWPMMDGRGKPGQQITPNQYWEQAKSFNPQKYDPNKWMKAAKAAGFTYAVLTTRHHEGYAMWPSKFGNFGTRTHMGGRDLVKPYIEACRRNGIKVGLYYSPPDWYFDKDFVNFSKRDGAKVALDADLKPRTGTPDPAVLAKHKAEYAAMVKGQIEELLTRYGKIDLLWFDGRPPEQEGDDILPMERIRQLQPAIVVNPRFHHHGDYKTYERKLTTDKVATSWAEFCNTWTNFWPHVADAPFRAPGFVLGQYVTTRALHINYLLGVGPTSDGEFVQGIYDNMAIVGGWMKRNGRSVRGAQPLPAAESASVPATSAGRSRFLFALPRFKGDDKSKGKFEADLLPATDESLTLKAAGKPKAVKLLADGSKLDFTVADGVITVQLPAGKRSNLVDVVQVDL
jgi:alpha-L-fucosidase